MMEMMSIIDNGNAQYALMMEMLSMVDDGMPNMVRL
jgi:hypothetical protein